MSDSDIFMDGVEYARNHPAAPCIPPASVSLIRPQTTKDAISTAQLWINGWKAGRNAK